MKVLTFSECMAKKVPTMPMEYPPSLLVTGSAKLDTCRNVGDSLARDLQFFDKTVKRWLTILENMYVVFSVPPFHRNIARALQKAPKFYFLTRVRLREIREWSTNESGMA